jgi:hypothetical protein|tara:strand:+ start:1864 stop:2115 length:252 start_codon:yes stop_codon:yes gene_type:complete
MIGKYIKIEYFIISFAIGILYVYLVQPKKEIVYRFPNPNNLDKLVYTDKNDNCYKYEVEEKNCTEVNKKDIKTQPIVENFLKK